MLAANRVTRASCRATNDRLRARYPSDSRAPRATSTRSEAGRLSDSKPTGGVERRSGQRRLDDGDPHHQRRRRARRCWIRSPGSDRGSASGRRSWPATPEPPTFDRERASHWPTRSHCADRRMTATATARTTPPSWRTNRQWRPRRCGRPAGATAIRRSLRRRRSSEDRSSTGSPGPMRCALASHRRPRQCRCMPPDPTRHHFTRR